MAAASAVALVIGELITLGQTVALARLLTPAQVGLFVAGGVLTTFIGNFMGGGLRSGLVHRDRDLDDAAATVFWATLGTGVLMTLLALAVAPLIGHVFRSHTAGLVAAAMSGGLILYSLTNVPEALLQRQFSVRRRLVVGPAVAASYAVVAVGAAALGLGVWSMVLGSYASALVWVVTLWLLCDWRPWWGRPSYRIWRELAGFGFPLVLGMIGDRAQKAVQAVATGRVLGAGDLGLLRYGERMARIPTMVLVEGGSISLFPAFTRLAADPQRFRSGYLRALRLAVAVAAGMAAMLVAVGVPLVVIVLGEEWREAGVVLVAMTGLALGKSVITVSEEAIKGSGRTRLLHWYTLTETSLSIVLLLVLIRPLGLVGVGLSISLTAVVCGVLVAALAGPVVGVSPRQALGATVPTIASSLVACAVAAPLEHLLLHSERMGAWGLATIALDGTVFLLVYVGALRVLAPTVFRELAVLVCVLWRRMTPSRGTPQHAAAAPGGPVGSR
ncbi:polysaccharide transporter, PST family [Geodermatophilus pulveris]|uniref:Polysaccharide transporter, PST family n=1 Tax=Geodermatophilus pulveris TaxID=1564159 RepID=A0A239J9T6_9ACTN|nr:oligosaccharide flippase family protein [Geodermatophilus pulveris]SNT02382.1 polysaccharide transporter, PST family [Geodermatophilus pulveris]